MHRIEKIQALGRAIRQADPDLGQHLIGGVLAVLTGVGVLFLVAFGMTSGVTITAPVL